MAKSTFSRLVSDRQTAVPTGTVMCGKHMYIPSGALAAYEATHEILERLASSDPGNAEWQRDLAVSHYKLAQVANEAGRQEEAVGHVLRCREVLRGMRERGMHLDPTAATVLEQLERMG